MNNININIIAEKLVEAKGKKEYWRKKYDNAFIFGQNEAEANYFKYKEEVYALEELIRTYG